MFHPIKRLTEVHTYEVLNVMLSDGYLSVVCMQTWIGPSVNYKQKIQRIKKNKERKKEKKKENKEKKERKRKKKKREKKGKTRKHMTNKGL